jgi:glycosyltransferase involved in cell wall biosynthesis
MKKLAFICLAGVDQFIDQIIAKLADDYLVRKFVVSTQQEIYNAIDWADIVWLEWANESAIVGTNYEGIKDKKQVITRLHSYEIFTNMPKQINWANVDKLIFVSPHVKEVLYELAPEIKGKVADCLIYNGLDMPDIPFNEHAHGFNVAWAGFINYKKNPQMMLQIMDKLVKRDKRYLLHIAGKYQDLRYKVYLEYLIKEMGLQDNIIFYGWINDMDSFWKDKNYLLHTSLFEAHSYSIVEAMARGIKPIVHNFRGSGELYAADMRFNTIDEAVQMITAGYYNSQFYRDWVINRGWTLEKQVKQIKEVLEGRL